LRRKNSRFPWIFLNLNLAIRNGYQSLQLQINGIPIRLKMIKRPHQWYSKGKWIIEFFLKTNVDVDMECTWVRCAHSLGRWGDGGLGEWGGALRANKRLRR
jgi:hypothetical protein